MKKLLTTALLCAIIQISFAQNAFVSQKNSDLLTYTKELNGSDQSDKRIFDKTLIWFYKSFKYNYDKIQTKDRETGIISGRALFYSPYKVSEKGDSVAGEYYTNYNFEWTVRIENNKINFSIEKIYINKNFDYEITGKRLATTATKIPFIVLTQSDEKMEKDWNSSKIFLMKNLDALVTSLDTELSTNDDMGWYFKDEPDNEMIKPVYAKQ
jgi:hypothetical protein